MYLTCVYVLFVRFNDRVLVRALAWLLGRFDHIGGVATSRGSVVSVECCNPGDHRSAPYGLNAYQMVVLYDLVSDCLLSICIRAFVMYALFVFVSFVLQNQLRLKH